MSSTGRGTGTTAGRGERRAMLWRTLAAVAVIAGALYFAVSSPVRLGLDLRGGTQIVLETRDTGTTVADAESTDRVVEVLRKRVDALGVSEPTLARSGDTRIIVELPGVQDPREAAEVIGRTAQLTFHPVVATVVAGEEAPAAPAGGRDLPDESGQTLRLGAPALTGDLVASADVGVRPPERGRLVRVARLLGRGGRALAEAHRRRRLRVAGRPVAPRGHRAGRRDHLLAAGRPLDRVRRRHRWRQHRRSPARSPSRRPRTWPRSCAAGRCPSTSRSSSSAPSVRPSAPPPSTRPSPPRSSAWRCTALFITLVYRLVGVAASIALACYSLISYAVLVAIGATLTLPGLAGFVLAIGLAIDANVLVFERAREEYAARGPATRADDPSGLQGALRAGFDKAWTAIIDSNVTTLIAAGLLFYLASGPVKGFGVTLGIGVLASMVSALVIARVLDPVAGADAVGPATAVLVGSHRERTDPPLARDERTGPDASQQAVAGHLRGAGPAVRRRACSCAGLNLGVEFTGGRLLEYSTTARVDVDAARQALAGEGLPRAVVQTSQEADGAERITVRTDPIDNDQAQAVEDALAELGGDVTKLRDELIGPTIGEELRTKALIALGVALLAQMAYLAVRFRWTFGAAAVLAMLHDVLIVVGVFAWLGQPVDGVFLAALLTVVGLSVNDTVVVFDRVRELRRDRPVGPVPATSPTARCCRPCRARSTRGWARWRSSARWCCSAATRWPTSRSPCSSDSSSGTLSSVFTATPLLLSFTRRWPEGGRAPRPARPSGGTTGRRPAAEPAAADRDRWASADPYADIPPGR